ncbi:hypothetical protein [Parasitella parasitica]|uniref:DDRGK domain-containing protein 1 n=1 Tax=Parasitella parasitica TaxID=35722 RepID=A0A0B7MPJ4_9FUNG|nr:hypothetical protein [Parasitella parasitica]
MASANKEDQGIPLVVFIPIILCIIGILVLLDIRQRQRNPQYETIDTHQQAFEQHFMQQDEDEQENGSDDNHGEGSSTAVRVKKVGKKRGEKLRRKEEMRQYREYMDRQRDLRRAQDEIYEEEYRRKKIEDSIKRTDEMEKRKKEKERKAKADAKEESKLQKLQEKDAKKRQSRFSKYNEKLKKLVKEKKLCDISELARATGLSQEEVVDILKKLCNQDDEFELCLWSGTDAFLFITQKDYTEFNQLFKTKGKMSIHDAVL